jgi:ABC-type nickel/cobalt efflux system permease component RcnA
MGSSIPGLLLGLLLGVRHALEPDHVVAVSVLSAERPSASRGLRLGALWGVGHAVALLVVVGILTILQARMSAGMADALELCVALMLIVLGAAAIRRALRVGTRGPALAHDHAHGRHTHPASERHVHVAGLAIAPRPLLVGLMHGLAGSGALTALVAAGIPSVPARFAYVTFFGLGSVLGMSALSGLVGWPLATLARRPAAGRAATALAGALSAALGVTWGWPLAAKILG